MRASDEHELAKSGLEPIPSEEADLDATTASFEIVTYPADFTLEGLVQKYQKQQIKIPGFQRKFVWKLPQASRLVESFLLGLPVPAIFLYTEQDGTLMVIDGQQRLLSICYFFEGYFGPADLRRRTIFSLSGLNEKSPYAGTTYQKLRDRNKPSFNRLNDSVLRAFVIKQLTPTDNTSVYHIFERLNTGGVQLASQEIRNCVYHGNFNTLLHELNLNGDWRAVYGKAKADERQRDVELILRFFALNQNAKGYTKPMKDFLSRYMATHRNANPIQSATFRKRFSSTMTAIRSSLGDKPFHIRSGLNAAVFDSCAVAFSKHPTETAGVKKRFEKLVRDEKYLEWVSSHTTDREFVELRLAKAEQILFE